MPPVVINGQEVPFDLEQYLTDFDYLKTDEVGDPALYKQAVAKAQQAFGLEPTGLVDIRTVKALAMTPRCGVSDAPFARDVALIWGLKTLKWFVTSYPDASLKSKVDACLTRCGRNWSEGLEIDFVQTNNKSEANLLVSFGRGTRANMDGPGGTLAWHYLAPRGNYTGLGLQGMADLDENWDWDGTKANGTGFEEVYSHEWGHALGLDHDTQGSGALMAPFYRRGLKKPTPKDFQRMIALGYRKRVSPLPGDPTDPPPPPSGGFPPQIDVKLSWPAVPQGPLYQGKINRVAAFTQEDVA